MVQLVASSEVALIRRGLQGSCVVQSASSIGNVGLDIFARTTCLFHNSDAGAEAYASCVIGNSIGKDLMELYSSYKVVSKVGRGREAW